MSKDQPQVISSGIDALVARLHDDGVKAGQEEAARIIEAARKEAQRLQKEAQQQADDIVAVARKKAATETRAAEEALQVAFRDMVLDMKNQLLLRLSDIFRQQVRNSLADPQLTAQLIREAAARLTGDYQAGSHTPDKDVRILLPANLLAMQEIRDNPERATTGALADLAFRLRDELLQQGVELMPHRGINAGFRISLNNGEVQLDINEQTIATLLLSYLQPRFQALLEGVIR